jgi:hypothetical protein
MKPVTIEVITYAPTVFYHCQHCELTFQEMGIGEKLRREEAAAALPDDLARDFQALSDWVHRLLERFGTGLIVKVVDAASIEGFAKSVRHRVGRYPAVIIDGRPTTVRGDFDGLEKEIERRLATRRVGGGRGSPDSSRSAPTRRKEALSSER